AQAELPRQVGQQRVFDRLHAGAFGGGGVFVPLKVEQTMGKVSDQFLGPGGAKTPSLPQRLIHTDEYLAVQRTGVVKTVAEGQDVRRPGVPKECFVQTSHFRRADQQDADPVIGGASLGNEPGGNTLEQLEINRPAALTITDVEFTHRVYSRGAPRRRQ